MDNIAVVEEFFLNVNPITNPSRYYRNCYTYIKNSWPTWNLDKFEEKIQELDNPYYEHHEPENYAELQTLKNLFIFRVDQAFAYLHQYMTDCCTQLNPPPLQFGLDLKPFNQTMPLTLFSGLAQGVRTIPFNNLPREQTQALVYINPRVWHKLYALQSSSSIRKLVQDIQLYSNIEVVTIPYILRNKTLVNFETARMIFDNFNLETFPNFRFIQTEYHIYIRGGNRIQQLFYADPAQVNSVYISIDTTDTESSSGSDSSSDA